MGYHIPLLNLYCRINLYIFNDIIKNPKHFSLNNQYYTEFIVLDKLFTWIFKAINLLNSELDTNLMFENDVDAR